MSILEKELSEIGDILKLDYDKNDPSNPKYSKRVVKNIKRY